MNEEEIKNLRHSFTNPYRQDLPKPKVNQFGHTILGGNDKTIDTDDIEIEIDEFGQIKANLKHSLIDTPKMSQWADNLSKTAQIEEAEETPENQPKNSDLYSSLLNELDEMDGSKKTTEEPRAIKSNNLKICINKTCEYSLPKDANFCLKCGAAQLKKFCAECGYNFQSEEKFCPDCGTKR